MCGTENSIEREPPKLKVANAHQSICAFATAGQQPCGQFYLLLK